MGEPHFCYCVSFVPKTAEIIGFSPLPRLALQGKCLLIRARCSFGFRPVPCGFLGHMVVLDQSGIHLADEVLHGNGRHFGTAQLDRPQQLGADKVIHHVFLLTFKIFATCGTVKNSQSVRRTSSTAARVCSFIAFMLMHLLPESIGGA